MATAPSQQQQQQQQQQTHTQQPTLSPSTAAVPDPSTASPNRSRAKFSLQESRGLQSVHSGDSDAPTHHLLAAPLTVGIVGAGYLGGQPIPGVEGGPRVIRDAGIINDLKKLGWQVRDHGDLVFDSSKLGTDKDPPVHVDPRYTTLKNCLTVGNACRQVYERVLNTARAQELALTLGGDHSLAIGSIAGVADAWGRDDLRVIWVDAHGDINTPATTPTGNLHGMPVAFLMHLIRADQPVPGFEWLYHTGNNKPILTPDRIVFIGLRDVDAGEKVNLKAHGIKCFSMKEIDRWGIGKVMNMAIKHVDPMGRKPIHLSFDVDGIDPLYCPSTGTKVKGGLTYREAMYVCEVVAETGRLVGMDVVEVNPSIGTPQDIKETTATACALVRSALGSTLL